MTDDYALLRLFVADDAVARTAEMQHQISRLLHERDKQADRIAALEAGACVVPPIASNYTSNRELSPDYRSGWNDCRDAMLTAAPPAAPDEAMVRDAMRWQAYRESKQTLYFLGAATPDEADAIVDSLMAAKLPIPSHRDELTAALTGDKA